MRLLLALLLCLGPAGSALAVDGVIEINQACAVNTGCTPDDTPGFPVTLRAGSYRLTSTLEVDEPAPVGIDVIGFGTVIDFNGFSMNGDPVGALQKGVARVGGAVPSSVTIKNGIIQDFDGGCIELGDSGRVENMTLVACEVSAISIGENGQVIGNRIVDTRGQDLVMGASTLYRDNQINDSFGSIPVSGGIAAGVNICGSRHCSPFPPRRRFYLTTTFYDGSQPLGAGVCDEGFHFASFWEIRELSTLEYDTQRGSTVADSGAGPTSTEAGWVRTGFVGNVASNPGTANCAAWQSSSGGFFGTIVNPSPTWGSSSSSNATGGWLATTQLCNQLSPVWCVQD